MVFGRRVRSMRKYVDVEIGDLGTVAEPYLDAEGLVVAWWVAWDVKQGARGRLGWPRVRDLFDESELIDLAAAS